VHIGYQMPVQAIQNRLQRLHSR